MSDDDEIDWDEWMAMSDAQREAIEKNAWREYGQMIDAMSREQYYRFRRKRRVALCLRWRKMVREYGFDFMRERVRYSQRMLVNLRHEYYGGAPNITADLQ